MVHASLPVPIENLLPDVSVDVPWVCGVKPCQLGYETKDFLRHLEVKDVVVGRHLCGHEVLRVRTWETPVGRGPRDGYH